MPPKKAPTRPIAKQTTKTDQSKGTSSTVTKGNASKAGASSKKSTGKTGVKPPAKGKLFNEH